MKIKLKKRQFRSDLLELIIMLTLIFMVITIYVPKAIWEEEAQAADARVDELSGVGPPG